MPRRCRDRFDIDDVTFVCERAAGHGGLHTESHNLFADGAEYASRPYTMTWGDPVIREADLPDLYRLPEGEIHHGSRP